MNKQSWNLINVVSTGIVVTVLFSLALFWVRYFVWFKLVDSMPEEFSRVIIRPSGLVPGEPAPQQMGPQNRIASEPPGSNEPNFRYSQVYVSRNREIVIGSAFGALWDITAEAFPFRDANERVYYRYGGGNEQSYICIDNRNGLIIRHYIAFEPNDEGGPREVEFIAGPNGISKTTEATLGRFHDPIVTAGMDPNRIGLYDKGTRRFYVIDFVEGIISKSFQLPEGDSREPIAIYGVGGIVKWANNTGFGIIYTGPEIWNAERNKWKNEKVFFPDGVQSEEEYRIIEGIVNFTYIPILDKTGRIHIYNVNSQTLTYAGYLPVPMSLFLLPAAQQNDIANPRSVLAYDVVPVYAIRRLPSVLKEPGKIIDVKYIGMCVGSVSREGTSLAAVVFDPNGKLVCRGDTMSNDKSTAEAIYDTNESTLAPPILFLLENLQPVAFEVASYLCGDRIEAGAGHRALFILPNSFIGMMGRVNSREYVGKQVEAFLLMAPSLILSVWLAIKVNKDAILAGLSPVAKKWWLIGTIAFGLPAYITYRLTRSKETLVSCQNCGKMRRPDMENCHRCGSKWEISELTPSNWRISD
ncbi:MAG: hypothetical protein ABSH16_10130 [Sedimentisphaerales bacterium]